jgi:hypothetical protein
MLVQGRLKFKYCVHFRAGFVMSCGNYPTARFTLAFDKRGADLTRGFVSC